MVYSRLARRVRRHGLASFADYLRVVERGGAELQEFINSLTTNKTDFFREPHHFEYLRGAVLPRLAARGPRRVRVWCAASSTGEEPYTLAMTLREACPPAAGWDVKVLASDIDTAVLAAAERGVYDADRAGGIPPALLRKYFLRGAGANRGKVSARPELRELLAFRRINLVDDPWPVRTRFDAIFCRNVAIYFDRDTQRRLFDRFAAHLEPGGYLFLGHSETLHGLTDRYAPTGGTVYQLRDRAGAPPAEPEYGLVVGEVKATRGPAVIKTVLGSCVAACLYDPETGVGGMNHFSLPGAGEEGASARYGAYAMELLVAAIVKAGGDRSRLRAKVFGGAKVLDVASEQLNVGARNAEFVLRYLADEGFPVAGQCLGGTRGLMVRFRPHTGQALARPLAARDLGAVVRDEERHGRALAARAAAPADDDVTLF
jgi:chemotaxis protein methyltransferase CheR